MKNKIVLIFLVFLSIVISADLVSADVSVSVENYYPIPVEAGDYFTIWLKVTNMDDSITKGSAVIFKQIYPFSLDPGEEKERIINELEPKSSITQKFKVRVDKEAKEGENNIVFEYKDCSGCLWKEKNMPITVIEYQTMFEVILQELTSEGAFIAIANIGKNPANAITIRIPEQEYFKTDLTSASIVGNLDSGDYTIAAFRILPKQQTRTNEEQELFVQIDYTDPFGVRRSVVNKILLNPTLLTRVGVGEVGAGEESIQRMQLGSRGMKQGSNFLTNLWFWASLILVIFLLRNQIKKIYRKLKELKQKS